MNAMTAFAAPERAVILAGLRLVQRMIADRPELVLTDDTGTPSRAAADAIAQLLEPAGQMHPNDIDSLYERVATGGGCQGDGFPVGLVYDLVAEFGDAVAAEEPVSRPAATSWIAGVAPRVRSALQALCIPSTAIPAAPSMHGLMAELDAQFGDRVEAGEPLDEDEAADWIAAAVPRADSLLM